MNKEPSKGNAGRIIAVFVWFLLSLPAFAIDTAWTGEGDGFDWDDPANWSDGVPRNDGSETYTAIIEGGYLSLPVDPVTIDGLEISNGTGLDVVNTSLTVLQETVFGPAQNWLSVFSFDSAPVIADLGNIASFSEGILENVSFSVASLASAPTIIQWQGANISVIAENARISLDGANAGIRNSLDDSDALADLSSNEGLLSIQNREFVTSGDFSNTGWFSVAADEINTSFTINGSLTENWDGVLTAGELKVHGYDITAILRWEGAQIHTIASEANIQLSGANAGIRNSLDDSDALAGLQSIEGVFAIYARSFIFSGDLSNTGSLSVVENGVETIITINGSLAQNVAGALTEGALSIISNSGLATGIEWEGAQIHTIGSNARISLQGQKQFDGGSVILSNFGVIPEPDPVSLSLLACGLMWLLRRKILRPAQERRPEGARKAPVALASLAAFAAAFPSASHAQLTAGDIAFIGYNSWQPAVDSFGWVALNTIPANFTINFTDSSAGTYLTTDPEQDPITSAFRVSEHLTQSPTGPLTWTSSAAISAGTIVTFDGTGWNIGSGSGGGLQLSASGDNIFAYTGSLATVPRLNFAAGGGAYADSTSGARMLAGITFGNNGWQTEGPGTTTSSYLPTGTQGTPITSASHTALYTGPEDSGYYSGPMSAATKTEWLSRLSDTSNWTVKSESDFSLSLYPTTLNISSFTHTAPPNYTQGSGSPWAQDRLLGSSNATDTIGKYGCFLTATSMLLNNYGHHTDPGRLNQFLADEIPGNSSNLSFGSIPASPFYGQTDGATGVPVVFHDQAFAQNLTREQIVSEVASRIASSGPVILRVPQYKYGLKDFPNALHAIIAWKVEQGEIFIRNPGSQRSGLPAASDIDALTLDDYIAYVNSSVDPSFSLNTNYEFLTGIRYTYAAAITDSSSTIRGAVHSPVDFVITDPIGRRLGYHPESDQYYYEIPESTYTRLPLIISPEGDVMFGTGKETPIDFELGSLISGLYSLDVYGIGDGGWTINFGISDSSGFDPRQYEFTGLAAMGTYSHFSFAIPEPATNAFIVLAGCFIWCCRRGLKATTGRPKHCKR